MSVKRFARRTGSIIAKTSGRLKARFVREDVPTHAEIAVEKSK
jgi:hypothetical protein